uniref:Secreted protein n=1 Tax=Ditylenchus dipsaci TaxID=166011 RepID=A0A915CWL5_9BILA
MNWLLVVATATVLFQIQLSWNTVEAGCGGGGGRRKRRSIAESPAVALRSSQLRKRREVSQFINCQQEQALVSQNNTSSTTTIILPLSSASGGVPRPLMVNSTSNFSSSTSPTTMVRGVRSTVLKSSTNFVQRRLPAVPNDPRCKC